MENARELLRAGADKVSLNTAAVERPELIAEVAQAFGCQCVVLAVDVRRKGDGKWEVTTHGGRRATGKDAGNGLRRVCVVERGDFTHEHGQGWNEGRV